MAHSVARYAGNNIELFRFGSIKINVIIIYGHVKSTSVTGATISSVTYEGAAEFIYRGTLIGNDNSVGK